MLTTDTNLITDLTANVVILPQSLCEWMNVCDDLTATNKVIGWVYAGGFSLYVKAYVVL